MEYQSINIEGNTHKLLIGQFIGKQCKIFFDYELLPPLNELLNDLSVKQSQSTFLNKIQDITSLINFGLKPIGLYFNGALPEYCRNNSILKKICNIFKIDHLLLYSQDRKIVFALQTLSINDAIIRQGQQFKLKLVKTKVRLQQRIGENLDIRGLVFGKQILTNQRLNELTIEKEIQLTCFKGSATAAVCLEDQSQILQGNIVAQVLTDENTTIPELQPLLLNDLVESVKVRLIDAAPPCYLAKRLMITFQGSELILQNYIDSEFDHKQEEQYIKQFFPTLTVQFIKVLENVQPIKIAKQEKQQIEQQQQLPEQPQVVNQVSVKNYNNQYLFMAGLLGLLIAIYLRTLLL